MSRLCGSLGLLLFATTAWAAAPPTAPAAVRVVGQATVSAKADRAELTLGVTTDKKTATAATQENERKMEQVLAAIKKEIGSDGDIKTSQISVTPRFPDSNRASRATAILGYTVSNTLLVRVNDIKAVGRILDRALEAGANTVDRVAFTLKDPEAAQNEALRAATAKARARALAMAEGLFLRVGQVLSVSEGVGDSYNPLEGFDKFKVESKPAGNVTVEPGSVDVTATVTVTFALTPR
jgi:uncharacterized protein